MKKRIILFFILIASILPLKVNAGRGCCSGHRGVCGCNKYGKQVCCDGKLSPTCRCNPPEVAGCTDYNADNYNSDANVNDGSCVYSKKGCTDPKAINYDSSASKDNGSCRYEVEQATNNTFSTNKEKSSDDDLGGIGTIIIGVFGALGAVASIKGNKKR